MLLHTTFVCHSQPCLAAHHYLVAFLSLFIFRYLRLVVSCVAFWRLRSTPPPRAEVKALGAQDVTVVIPSLDGDSARLRDTVASVLATGPHEIILVTPAVNYYRALNFARQMGERGIRVTTTKYANKRLQMVRGVELVRTRFTTFADDDVMWKPRTLAWMLAPFQDPCVGATGTCQRLRRAFNASPRQRLWSFLAALYLERRNFDCGSCNAVDGGLPCLSGRTVTYRSHIVKDPAFRAGFIHERWCGRQLNAADDDNFLTRWIVSHGWQMKMQFDDECEVETTLEDNPKFLLQCLRWSRSNWRSNLSSLFVERHVWRQQPWSTYSVFLTTITASALLGDALLAYLFYMSLEACPPGLRGTFVGSFLAFWFASKFVKLLGHFRRYPTDVLLLPLSIAFGYFHSLVIKPYAFCTIAETTWGSRPDAGAHRKARKARAPPHPTPTSTTTAKSIDGAVEEKMHLLYRKNVYQNVKNIYRIMRLVRKVLAL